MTDITSLENATLDAKKDFARAADNYSASFKRILRVITIIEENLRERRRRIEEIQTRHEQLVHECQQLGKSLESETSDLAQNFTGVITDLGTDFEIVKLLLGDRPVPAPEFDLVLQSPDLAAIPDCDQEARRAPVEEQDELAAFRPALNRILRKDSRPATSSAGSEDDTVA